SASEANACSSVSPFRGRAEAGRIRGFLPRKLSVSPLPADDGVCRAKAPEGGLRSSGPAERGNRGRQPLVPKALPGPLTFPEVDDAKALLGRACDVQEQTGWRRIHELCGDALVLVPTRGNVLHEGVGHVFLPLLGGPRCGPLRTMEEAGLASV